ncbi:MAG: ECF-type sigma factor [Acidobacteriota bacterium]
MIEPSESSPSEITQHLMAWSEGDEAALDRLMPLVAEELRRIAARYMQREDRDHTLQPTALVNELMLKLMHQRAVRWESGSQFFGCAANMMRLILVDHARARQTVKRGGRSKPLSLDLLPEMSDEQDRALIALDDALQSLATVDERQCLIVELRFFAGLSHQEIAAVLGISGSTAKREWRTARLWLHREMGGA